MTFKKRKKNTRFRGSQTHRRGHRKRTKGLGNKGGVGMSGSENQKKSLVIKLYGIEYFGKDKALRRGRKPKKLQVIKLDDLIKRFDSLVKQGKAKVTKSGFEFNLEGYKLLAGDGLVAKMSVKATAASAGAVEQVKSAGGTIELKANKEEAVETQDESKEEKSEKKVEAKKPAK